MDTLRVLVQNLIILVILAVLLEMMMPGGEMRRYIKMVLGLMVIVAVIQGINGLSAGSLFKEVNEYAWRTGGGGSEKIDILDRGKKIDAENKKKAMDQYRSGLEKQVSGLAGLAGQDEKIKLSGTEVKLQDDPSKNDYGKIKQITLVYSKGIPNSSLISPVDPVSVTTGTGTPNGRSAEKPPSEYMEAARTAAGKVASFYSLSPDQVNIKFQ